MDRTRITAILERNADLWPIPVSPGKALLQWLFIATILLLYTGALGLTLILATTGAAGVMSQLSPDAVLQEGAGFVSIVNFSLYLLITTWIAFVALFGTSYVLADIIHTRRRRQQQEEDA